jgi:hypothetical protein
MQMTRLFSLFLCPMLSANLHQKKSSRSSAQVGDHRDMTFVCSWGGKQIKDEGKTSLHSSLWGRDEMLMFL